MKGGGVFRPSFSTKLRDIVKKDFKAICKSAAIHHKSDEQNASMINSIIKLGKEG